MQKYHKIEALYERDMEGTKKLLVDQFRNPAVKMLKDGWQVLKKCPYCGEGVTPISFTRSMCANKKCQQIVPLYIRKKEQNDGR